MTATTTSTLLLQLRKVMLPRTWLSTHHFLRYAVPLQHPLQQGHQKMIEKKKPSCMPHTQGSRRGLLLQDFLSDRCHFATTDEYGLMQNLGTNDKLTENSARDPETMNSAMGSDSHQI